MYLILSKEVGMFLSLDADDNIQLVYSIQDGLNFDSAQDAFEYLNNIDDDIDKYQVMKVYTYDEVKETKSKMKNKKKKKKNEGLIDY